MRMTTCTIILAQTMAGTVSDLQEQVRDLKKELER